MFRTTTVLFAAAVLSLCAGCSPLGELAGDWESTDPIGQMRNAMAIDSGGEGEATLFFIVAGDPTLYTADFDLRVSEVSVVNGDKSFVLDLECVGGCTDLDFRMECDLRGDADELDCAGDELWEGYDYLDWERN